VALQDQCKPKHLAARRFNFCEYESNHTVQTRDVESDASRVHLYLLCQAQSSRQLHKYVVRMLRMLKRFVTLIFIEKRGELDAGRRPAFRSDVLKIKILPQRV
jgi:hypothetical protein